MKKVNISLMHFDGDTEIKGLIHAIEYVESVFHQNGWTVDRSSNSFNPKILNVVFGAHTNPRKFIAKVNNLIIFNTEQLHPSSKWSSMLYLEALNKNMVWDYSPGNLNYINHDRKSEVPFLYCKDLSLRVNKNVGDKEYDLLFYGLMNERRRKIIDELLAQDLKIKCLFGVYGEELDFYLSRSRAVLNLHYYEKHFFQAIRAFYPLSNGIPVISENYDLRSGHPIYEEVIFHPKEKIFKEYALRLLRDDGLEDLFAKNLEKYKSRSAQVDFSEPFKIIQNNW